MLKSLSTQFAMTLVLGPLGLIYSSVAAAVFLTLVFAVLYFTELGSMAALVVWPIAIITGLVFVKMHNDRMRQSGSRLLLGPGEDGDLVSAAGVWGRGLAVLSIMAIGGYFAFWYLPGSSKIGRIVEATPTAIESSTAASSAVDAEDPITSVVTTAAEPAENTFTIVTVDDRVVTPVVIGTSSGPDVSFGEMLYVDAEVVNLRKGPGNGYSILVQVERGDELSEIGRQGGWVNVTAVDSGITGWIFGRLVSNPQR